jgi:two-component system, NarL family, sensor histidine kinase ComP
MMNDSQQFFETILNHTFDMLLIVNQDRNVLYATPNFYEITGYSPEQLRHMDAFVIIHPDDLEYMLHNHHHLLSTTQTATPEYRMIDKNGKIRYFECRTTPLPHTKDYLQVVSIRDFTERKQMELELEHHKNRYANLQNSLKNFSQEISSIMKVSDLEERLLKELVTILPDSNPRIIKGNPKKEVNPYFPELTLGKMEFFLDKIFVKIGERYQEPYILTLLASAIHEKMDSIWLETLAYYAVMVFENLKMIEDLMNRLEVVVQSKETPEWVFRMMFQLQEQQRMTLSSDLHDTVLQDQIELYRRLESLLNRHDMDKETKEKLKEIEDGLLDIIHEIRMTCNQLRPPMLRDLGLERSLENLFEHIQITSTFKIIFTSEGIRDLPLSEEYTITIYRIVQEILQQAEDSKADLIEFHLYAETDKLKMVYRDNRGEVDEAERDRTLSHPVFTSINHRAKSLGGKIEPHILTGVGLNIDMELPIY